MSIRIVHQQFELLRNGLRNLDVVISILTTNYALIDFLVINVIIDDDIVNNLIQNNSRISTEEIAERLNIDKSTTFPAFKKD